MRPSGRTAVASVRTSPAPPTARLPEMNEMPVVSVSVVARILAHRRDEHPIGKRQISNRERIKQAGHGQLSVIVLSCQLPAVPACHVVVSTKTEASCEGGLLFSNPNATCEQSSIHPNSRCRANRGGIDSISSLIREVEAGRGIALARTRTSGRFVCCCRGRLVPSTCRDGRTPGIATTGIPQPLRPSLSRYVD